MEWLQMLLLKDKIFSNIIKKILIVRRGIIPPYGFNLLT